MQLEDGNKKGKGKGESRRDKILGMQETMILEPFDSNARILPQSTRAWERQKKKLRQLLLRVETVYATMY